MIARLSAKADGLGLAHAHACLRYLAPVLEENLGIRAFSQLQVCACVYPMSSLRKVNERDHLPHDESFSLPLIPPPVRASKSAPDDSAVGRC